VKKSEAVVQSIRPPGRMPVISGRVHESLHRKIQEAAKASGRTMSEELAALATEAFQYRDRFGDPAVRLIVERLAIAFINAGGRAAREGIQDWTTDLDCRRDAVLSVCGMLITEFLSRNPEDQVLVVESLKGRVWTAIVNKLNRKEGEGQ
jgi:hypothetical protein